MDVQQGVCPRCGASLVTGPGRRVVRPPAPTGVQGTWSQSVLLLAAVAVVVIAAVGAFLALVLSGPGGFSGIRVLAPAGSCWNGAVGMAGSMTSVHGCGPQDYPLACGGTVNGAIQKDDTGSWTLTVQILSRGFVVQQQSTNGPYGGVSVTGAC